MLSDLEKKILIEYHMTDTCKTIRNKSIGKRRDILRSLVNRGYCSENMVLTEKAIIEIVNHHTTT